MAEVNIPCLSTQETHRFDASEVDMRLYSLRDTVTGISAEMAVRTVVCPDCLVEEKNTWQSTREIDLALCAGIRATKHAMVTYPFELPKALTYRPN